MIETGELYGVAQTASETKKDTLTPVNDDPMNRGLYRVTTYDDFYRKPQNGNETYPVEHRKDKDRS